MVIPLRITITERPPAWATVRQWRQLRRAMHFDTGEHWRAKIAPLHFRAGASSRYRYESRSRKYRQFKTRVAGKTIKRGNRMLAVSTDATRDLVFTGLLRETILDLSHTRGFPTRATVNTAKLPVYAPRRQRPGNLQPPVFDEATRINQTERRELFRVLRKSFQANSRRLRRRHTSRVRRINSKAA